MYQSQRRTEAPTANPTAPSVAEFRAAIEESFPEGTVFDGRTKEGKLNRQRRDLMLAMLAKMQDDARRQELMIGTIDTMGDSLTEAWDLQRDARMGTQMYHRGYINALKALVTLTQLTRFTGQELTEIEAFFDGPTEAKQLVIGFKLAGFEWYLTPGENQLIARTDGFNPMQFHTDYEGAIGAKELLAVHGLLGMTNEGMQRTMEHTMPSDALDALYDGNNDAAATAIQAMFGDLGGNIAAQQLFSNGKPASFANVIAHIAGLNDLPGHEGHDHGIHVVDVTEILKSGRIGSLSDLLGQILGGNGYHNGPHQG